MAVSPAAAARLVLFGKILRVVDEHVRAFGQLAYSFIEFNVAGFVVGGVDENSIFGFDAKSHATLRMVQPRRLQLDAIFHRDAAGFDIVEVTMRRHLIEPHGKVRRSHLIGQDLLETASSRGTLKEKTVLRVGIQRTEERHPLNVIPMKVRDEDVGGKWLVAEFSLQLLAEHAESGAAVEDVDAVAEGDFCAGGVAFIAHVLVLWGRRRTAYAPELNPHRLVTARGPKCSVSP